MVGIGIGIVAMMYGYGKNNIDMQLDDNIKLTSNKREGIKYVSIV